MKRADVVQVGHGESLAGLVALNFVNEIDAAADRMMRFGVALCGGRILRSLCHAIVAESKARGDRWAHVHFFWSDERCVLPTDPESNFAQAWESLLQPLSIPHTQVHRIRGEDEPEAAAAAASQELRRYLRTNDTGVPILDLVLLGMGEDGHVASLFPGDTPRVDRPGTFYRAVLAPKPPPRRVTLTYAAIAAAERVWVLISGLGKEAVLRQSLARDGNTPLARVLGSRANTRIFTDLIF